MSSTTSSSGGPDSIVTWLREKLIETDCLWNATPLHSDNSSTSTWTNDWAPPVDLLNIEVILLLAGYSASFTLAILGNAIAAGAFFHRRLPACSDDVRPLLANFCFVNMLSAFFCIPFTVIYQLVGSWTFGATMCPVITGFQVIATTEAILTHLAIGFNRLWSILFPFRANVAHGRQAVLLTWFLAMCLAAPSLVAVTVSKRGCFDNKLYLACAESWSHDSVTVYTWTLLTFMFIVPSCVLIVIYMTISRVLASLEKKSKKHAAEEMASPAARRQSAILVTDFSEFAVVERPPLPDHNCFYQHDGNWSLKRRMLRMLQIVFGLFVVTSLPLHALFVYLSLIDANAYAFSSGAIERLYWGFHWLSTSTTFQSPMVYYFFRDQFRPYDSR